MMMRRRGRDVDIPWGVAATPRRGYSVETSRATLRLTAVAAAVRYAPRVVEDARALAAALTTAHDRPSFDFHAAHLRTGDRAPTPLVDCVRDFGGRPSPRGNCAAKMSRDNREGACLRDAGAVGFADAAALARAVPKTCALPSRCRFFCVQRGAGVFLNMLSTFWRISGDVPTRRLGTRRRWRWTAAR